jgi:hypothetical protein
MDIYLSQKTHQRLCELLDIDYQPIEFEPIVCEENDCSSARPGNKNGMFGLTGKNCPHYGKKHLDSRKKNISKGLKGYKKSEEHLRKLGEAHAKMYLITYPDGTEKVVKGLQRFCKDNNLTNTLMQHVANGKQHQHKGFKCKYL